MIKFKEYLIELKKSYSKKHYKIWAKGLAKMYSNIFNSSKWFHDAKELRIFLPLKDKTTEEKVETTTQKEVESKLKSVGYEEIKYKEGTASKDKKNFERIGKILGKIKLFDLQKAFAEEGSGSGKRQLVKVLKNEKLWVVISKHLIDVIGMSTEKGWSSCMSLVDGTNKNYITSDLQYGSLIAYMISLPEEDLNKSIEVDKAIARSKGRVLIRPLFVKTNSLIFDTNDFILEPERKTYGTVSIEFLKVVRDWCSEVNKGKLGHFKIPANLYKDDIVREKIIFSDEQLKKWVKENNVEQLETYLEQLIKNFNNNDTDSILRILKTGLGFNAKLIQKVLCYASKNEETFPIVKYIAENYSAVLNIKGYENPLEEAILNKQVKTALYLLSVGIKICDEWDLLYRTVTIKNIEILKKLIEAGVDINIDDGFLLGYAFENNRYDIVEFILYETNIEKKYVKQFADKIVLNIAFSENKIKKLDPTDEHENERIKIFKQSIEMQKQQLQIINNYFAKGLKK